MIHKNKFVSFTVALCSSALLLTACGGGNSADGSSTTTTPQVGYSCPATVMSGGIYGPTDTTNSHYGGAYILDVNGPTISSFTVHGLSSVNHVYSAQSLTLTAYACNFTGTVLGTATGTMNGAITSASNVSATFSFAGSPIAVPTNCSSGHKTVAFVLSGLTIVSGDSVSVAAQPKTSQCAINGVYNVNGGGLGTDFSYSWPAEVNVP